jgi:hypothetical protein
VRVIERIVVYGVLTVIAVSMVAAVLPKILPAVTALFVFAVVGRYVWWHTR